MPKKKNKKLSASDIQFNKGFIEGWIACAMWAKIHEEEETKKFLQGFAYRAPKAKKKKR